MLFDGYASQELKHLLYSAADLVVLSFRPSFNFDSGSLADTVGWGLPVVCSDHCQPGESVARLGLGPVFEAGNSESLVEAVRSAPASLDAATVARARDEHSVANMAKMHLRALEDE
jgi:glycosyltransferase involved in cell wall biosynthesis